MDSEAVNQASTEFFTSGLGAFEAPVPANASPALSSLVAHDVTAPAALEDRLTSGRLGVASSLYRALRLKHPPTAKHSLRVALGCSVFSSYLKLDEKTREQIEIAALLHDVGKLGIPEPILNKPARLDADECEVMERHLPFAVHILESFCDDPIILDTICYSGTWYDGTRPVGCEVMGDALPLGARILAIQNAFDAMTTDMVYRKALPHEQAISELLVNTPTQFDPKLVSAFCEVNSDSYSQLRTESVRRWVEMSNQGADGLWSLAATLSPASMDPQTIFQQRLLEAMQDGVVFVDLSARILVWNGGAEELTGLSKESVHHKQWQPQIIDLRDMEGNVIKANRCPLLDCLKNAKEGMHRMTLTNRTKTNSRVAINVHMMPARDSTGICHGAIMMLHDVSPEQTLEERVQNLHTRATKDALTGVGNRAAFDKSHAELVTSHARSGQPLALVMCDIDRFKSINDKYGHQAGDAALVDFAALIARHSRGNDLVARYGGEEFVLLCPGCSGEIAVKKAEEIRHKLAATKLPALNNSKMTASFGVTESRQGDTPESMLKRADKALYHAKSSGRNRVIELGEDDVDETQAKPIWFSWASKIKEDKILHRKLKCSVPMNVVTEKVRGFISDNNAEIISIKSCSVVLGFDERSLPTQRQSDRPVRLTMYIVLKPNAEQGYGTLIDVRITARRGRDRRMEEVSDRADRFLKSLKSYLIAEEDY